MQSALVALLIATQFAPAAYGQDKPKHDNPGTASIAKASLGLPDPVDYNYAWDEFDDRGRMVWTCRGIQSGAFVPPELCKFKPKSTVSGLTRKYPAIGKNSRCGVD